MNDTTSNAPVDKTTSEIKEDVPTSEPLNSLSPISDADKDGYYSEMLLWALNNREEKDIKISPLLVHMDLEKVVFLKHLRRNIIVTSWYS